MLSLIIGDIVNQTDYIEELLTKWAPQVNEIVFLGNYFGGPMEDKDAAIRTAEWLVKSTAGSTKRVHLLGNADVDYLLFTGVPASPSYSIAKAKAIAKVFPAEFIHSFKIAHHTQDWLLSHAGVTKHWIHQDVSSTEMKAAYLNQKLKKHLEIPNNRNLFTPGVTRGGYNEQPGPLWCDWFLDFDPSPGVNQICAHTPVPSTCIKTWSNNQSLCFIPFTPEFPLPRGETQNLSINTGLSQFILLNDGQPFAITPGVENLDCAILKPLIRWI